MNKKIKKALLFSSITSLSAISATVILPIVKYAISEEKDNNISFRNVSYKEINKDLTKNIKNLNFNLEERILDFDWIEENNRINQNTFNENGSKFKIKLKYIKENGKFELSQNEYYTNKEINKIFIDLTWDNVEKQFIVKHNNVIYKQKDMMSQINRQNTFFFIPAIGWLVGALFAGITASSVVAANPEIITKPIEIIGNGITSIGNSISAGGSTTSGTSSFQNNSWEKIKKDINDVTKWRNFLKIEAVDIIQQEFYKPGNYFLVGRWEKLSPLEIAFFPIPLTKEMAINVILNSATLREIKKGDKWTLKTNNKFQEDTFSNLFNLLNFNLKFLNIYTRNMKDAENLAHETASMLNYPWIGYGPEIHNNSTGLHFKHYHVGQIKDNKTEVYKKEAHIFFGDPILV